MDLQVGVDRRNGNFHHQGGLKVVADLFWAVNDAAESIDVPFNGGERMFELPGDLQGFLVNPFIKGKTPLENTQKGSRGPSGHTPESEIHNQKSFNPRYSSMIRANISTPKGSTSSSMSKRLLWKGLTIPFASLRHPSRKKDPGTFSR